MGVFVTDDRLQSAGLATTRTVEVHRKQVCAVTRRVYEKSLFGDIPFSEAKLDRIYNKTLKILRLHLELCVVFRARAELMKQLGGNYGMKLSVPIAKQLWA
ncbi:hypothetical protein ROLI_048120 (plasmid) [Roseobacter fucihabitans]|uniref:Uncharacterized protein n=2 Tax=Roseobacter fucihabitans TaxID=1537242 RepID=A0ABZ2BZS3_9RHOB|nr:hypothetical protein [Roseobacter litoralis]